MAEEVGFEPTVPCGTTVFKTAAFDHSATPPRQLFQPMSPFRRGGLRVTCAGQAKTMRNRLEVKLIYEPQKKAPCVRRLLQNISKNANLELAGPA